MKDIICKVQPAIYIVATPIGNLKDITYRAVETLKSAHIIACEDTRVSGKLLREYSICTKTISYNDHNAPKVRPKLIKIALEGKAVALISDAGTPLVSDPGYKLVQECIANDIRIIPIGGLSSPIAALMASGLGTDIFKFIGFLPPKKLAKEAIIKDFKKSDGTIIIFESAKRIEATIKTIATHHPSANIVIGREITKKFEQFIRNFAFELSQSIKNYTLKGEIVLMVKINKSSNSDLPDSLDKALLLALKTMRVSDASSVVSNHLSLPRRSVYKRALKLLSARVEGDL